MEISKENIVQIELRLKRHKIIDVDIRNELVDHFAQELETMEGNFNDVFEPYFRAKKRMIRQILVATARRNFATNIGYVIRELFSVRFLLLYGLTIFAIYKFTEINGKDFYSGIFMLLPILVPAPITIIMFNQSFRKKSLTYRCNAVWSIYNWIFAAYTIIGNYWLIKGETSVNIYMYSFFLSSSMYGYYLYFKIKKENSNYLKFL